MAACELMRNNATRYAIFYVDSAEDVTKLPTTTEYGIEDLAGSPPAAPGSLARVKDGSQFILGSDDAWTEYSGGSSGGGGSTVDLNPMDSADISAMFEAV